MPSRDRGYVLPYVLGVILMLSVVTSITASYLSDSTDVMFSIEQRSRTERALDSAQSSIEYALFNATPIANGLDMSGSSSRLSNFLGQGQEDLESQDLWRMNGEWRYVETNEGPVYVRVWDASGLVSLNTGSAATIAILLESLGIDRADAEGLVAKLQDYYDLGNLRRFQGAERAEYRLNSLPPPTNRSVRHHSELFKILDWDEALSDVEMTELIRYSTIQVGGSEVNMRFAPTRLREIFSDQDARARQEDDTDILGEALSDEPTPGDTFRVAFYFQGETGLIRERQVEIVLSPIDVRKPFQTFHVFDNTFTEQLSLRRWLGNAEVKRVFETTSGQTE